MAPFWPKIVLQGTIFGSSWGSKSFKNRIFGSRSAQGPSKNDIWKGVWKKHEHLMKNRCTNECFLMARNHVWRYTLRLFHTFVISEKYRKIFAKWLPKVIVDAERHRRTPWTLAVESKAIESKKSADIGDWHRKIVKKHAKTIEISPRRFPKSMKNRACVADAFLEHFGAVLGRQYASSSSVRAPVLGAIFVQK